MTPHICPVCHSTSVVTRAPMWAGVMLLIGLIVWPLIPIAIICAIVVRPSTCRSCGARAIPAATPHGKQLVEQHGIQLPAVDPDYEVNAVVQMMCWAGLIVLAYGIVMHFVVGWS